MIGCAQYSNGFGVEVTREFSGGAWAEIGHEETYKRKFVLEMASNLRQSPGASRRLERLDPTQLPKSPQHTDSSRSGGRRVPHV